MKKIALKPRPLAAVLLVIGVALCTTAAHAQWKWKDKSGSVQYSDLPPPPSVPESDILQKPKDNARKSNSVAAAPAAAASVVQQQASAPSTPRGVDPELEAKRKQAELEQANKQKAEEAKLATARAENCARAKSYIQALEEGQRIARTNAKGEREILDDQGRAEEVRRARSVMAADCNK